MTVLKKKVSDWPLGAGSGTSRKKKNLNFFLAQTMERVQGAGFVSFPVNL